MPLLIVGLALFIAIHLVPTRPKLRDDLRQRLGEGGYKALFSLISLVGFALIVYGFGRLQVSATANPQIWIPPVWTRHLAFLLMLPAMVLLVASQIPSRIRTLARHPLLVAIKIWALAHLLANGDLASIVLFGSLLAYAVYDRISVKHRQALGPLGSRTGSPLSDATVVGIGIALYVFMLLFGHSWLIGVPLLPGWT
jgi:uncharacterized membrane protein